MKFSFEFIGVNLLFLAPFNFDMKLCLHFAVDPEEEIGDVPLSIVFLIVVDLQLSIANDLHIRRLALLVCACALEIIGMSAESQHEDIGNELVIDLIVALAWITRRNDNTCARA